jgi:nucleotide-binding universal stress UspA family protein
VRDEREPAHCGWPTGASFLREAKAAGADLLLKGAYTRSRIRQMIFGGATRHIILESGMPVLMAR